MKHQPKHVRPSTGRWAVIAWLLAAVFFGVSYVYALNDSAFAFVVWFIIFMAWTYLAISATTQYFKARKSTR
jgi:hypothetical protein